MENKYKEGELVFALEHPEVMLTVRRYVDKIYYCRVKDSDNEKDRVYVERELGIPKASYNIKQKPS